MSIWKSRKQSEIKIDWKPDNWAIGDQVSYKGYPLESLYQSYIVNVEKEMPKLYKSPPKTLLQQLWSDLKDWLDVKL